MYRTAFARQVRLFSTSPIIRNKGPIDTAKAALKAVDRTVADTLVKSIETGEAATQKAKEVAGMNADQASSEASGTVNDMAAKAKEAAGVNANKDASGAANEMAGAAKGKANELSGAAKGKAEEIKGKMS
ncbi:hypothetical protein LTS18_005720 [Coniosporium uncinatum]|uniref:Uncharacterized protein n=1 Tax=Coniosporium uncinatum TaxID=93489 RepID=A0ACC3D4S4_9PEZI|nr:hypothetical protein LTS18_005720 [Coniosporium uncinatum]